MTGPTGLGKTTLAKLLTGLHTPDSGTVRYDGHDLASLPPAEPRRRIVLVPQRVHMIEGTLLDNLRLVPGDPDEKAIARSVEHLASPAGPSRSTTDCTPTSGGAPAGSPPVNSS
ncbi:ATP-binding cassette domain-containing protein [Streptomyces cyaneofuscatus]|uniref:ATP-binding cassette domain-containing protein n=1 Tax=Streptomyces cyaneofuscatus TaxID=66883 RepID=UPI003825DCF8